MKERQAAWQWQFMVPYSLMIPGSSVGANLADCTDFAGRLGLFCRYTGKTQTGKLASAGGLVAMRCLLILMTLGAVFCSGCCTPLGCGPGCDALQGGCYDCDGSGGRPLPCGPLDALRQARRSLVCGGGCGEVYYGEWISTPPYANDPCCGDQFTGCATRCTPFCVPPGSLLAALTVGLYGKRFDCGGSCSECCGAEADCGCGSATSDHTPSPGCATCASRAMGMGPAGTRVAARQPATSQHRAHAARPARMATRTAGPVQDGRTIR